MRVYLVGAHSTGKTTLCRYISEKYSLPMITETARVVLAEMEVPLSQLRFDMDLVDKFQTEVTRRQAEVERSRGNSFVSDRAFDGLAYAAEHATVTSKLIRSAEFEKYVEWVSKGIVFFVRPHKELLIEDGVRETPTWESVLRIDGMVKLLLESFGVEYVPLASLSMQERARTVDFILRRALEVKRT